MTPNQFQSFWTLKYPGTIPLSHEFKHWFNDKWFRIHSLPDSKRYADNNEELNIILTRQNEIITDLVGDNSPLLLVTGELNWGERQIFITDEEEVFKQYSFKRLDNIDLYKFNSEDYDEHEIFRLAFSEITWNKNRHNQLLEEIANAKVRAFFIEPDKDIIIVPYDGGTDFILKDSETKNYYKQKYKDWLSKREDGL